MRRLVVHEFNLGTSFLRWVARRGPNGVGPGDVAAGAITSVRLQRRYAGSKVGAGPRRAGRSSGVPLRCRRPRCRGGRARCPPGLEANWWLIGPASGI